MSPPDTQRDEVNIDPTQQEKYHFHSPMGNFEFHWKVFNIHIWGRTADLFPPPRRGKAILMENKPPRNFQSSLKITWEQLLQFTCSWMTGWRRRTIRPWNKVDSCIHWDFVTTFFIDITLFLVHSSSFHCHSSSCDFRRNFYE